MKTVFGVKWIEVEFGQRDEGWKLFADREKCIETTKKDSAEGCYSGGGYLGPVRPLEIYEIPYACLTKEMKASIKKSGMAWTPNNWNPKMTDSGTYIN